MGEEKKKAEEEKKPEEKKTEEVKDKEAKKEEKPAGEEKKSEGNDDKNKENKDSKENQPPPPPPEIVLRVYMHCEGCARKVRKCLTGLNGVEDVMTDRKSQKVVVKGEKADPLKVLDRLQKKTHRQVELLSPVPVAKPPAEENKKTDDEKQAPKPEEKKQEPKVITVVLKVHMHCEACSLEMKKRIERMKEVEEVKPDLKNSQVTVKGTFEPAKLVDYVYKRTGRHVTIVKQDPPAEKKGENGGEEVKDGKKDGAAEGGEKGGGEAAVEEGPKMVELKRNEFNYYYPPPRYAMEMYTYPPQMFSDENPNACSIM